MNLVNRNLFLAKIFMLLSLSIVESVAPQAHGAGDIASYIQAFKQLGYTNAQILSEFKKAVHIVDHNNSNVALSLENNNENNDDNNNRVFWGTVSLLGLTAVAAGICLVYYLLKEDPAETTPAQQPAPNNIETLANTEEVSLNVSPETIRSLVEIFHVDPISGAMVPVDPISGEIILTN